MMEIEEALELLSKSPDLVDILNKELSLPNIPTPTMGGEVFWNELASVNGWKLQQNMITHHARILNSNNVRVAWGTVNGMYTALDRLVKASSKYTDTVDATTSTENMQRLKQLKELLDIGAISQSEYDQKKAKLIDRI
ncbi:MAG: SHOCT domain-containing protein [Clostridiales bacterium]|nr:SHOCT domain-containing protein [Clostridiales bacterium]